MKQLPNKFNQFQFSVYHFALIYLFLLALFLSFRIALFVLIGGFEKTGTDFSELALALFTGFRFDTLPALAGMTPLLFITYIELIAPSSGVITKIKYSVFKILTPILATIYLIISLVDLYFFQFFQSHINILVFGFFQDDTTALIYAIWDDYPVIWIFIALIASIILFVSFTHFILKRKPFFTIKKKTTKFIFPLLMLTITFIGIRGSLTDNPLRMEATTISTNDNINNLVCNGVYALKDAISTNNKSKVNIDIQKTLTKLGFSSLEELELFYNTPNDSDSLCDNSLPFFETTSENMFLKNNPPNVIFILSESMSSYYLSLHNRDNFNLLGQLENVLPQCIVFNHFLPSTPATIGSLENLTVNTVQYPLSQSPFLNISLNTSVAKPYKDAGYETIFVTGGDLGWRNMGSFIKQQHFNQVEGYPAVKAETNFSEKHQYGAYDEYLYNYIYSKLEKNITKPSFIFALTISNHTPYTIPSHYKPNPLNIPYELMKNKQTETEFTERSLLCFQYANDCLGSFIEKIKASPLGENTIIAITGDHNIRKIMNFPNENLLQKQGVPFILYIPQKYMPIKDSINTFSFGSHKDIFPTLFNLSLSKASYLKSGINMLSPAQSTENLSISEFKIFMNDKGCVVLGGKDQFFEWSDKEKTKLKSLKSIPSEDLNLLMKKGKAQVAAMDIAIQKNLAQ